MGGGLSCMLSEEEKQSQMISKALKKEELSKTHNIVLLGPGESGKSTIFKQVKIIYDAGFQSPEEREPYKQPIHGNIIEGIKKLITHAEKSSETLTEEGLSAAHEVLKLQLNDGLNSDRESKISHLWNNENAIRLAYEDRSNFQLGDSVAYMLNNIGRIAAPDYIPTEEDVVRSRVRTSGIVEELVLINKIKFKFVDVGGQRGERRKWIHCFHDVQAVLYVCAISEYDQVLMEDETQNRVLEALELFSSICNLEVFSKTPMIVFLNKRDIFEDKFNRQVGDLSHIFPEYQGGYDVDTALGFLLDKFEDCMDDPNRVSDLYFHVTCATDKGNMAYVFNAVQDMVIKQNLVHSQLF